FHRPVCAFVNWSLFEQPGLDLDQIDVPVIELDEFAPPTPAHIRSLIDASLANLQAIGDGINPLARSRITRELEQFPFDPGAVYAALG
ncbi:hypothetical protein J8J27_29570, partial [Mycobacterium tuberculosis]|nr:hypothetical protein [Mycobacterium tuberculosis]